MRDAHRYNLALLAILAIAGAYVFWDIARPFNQTDEFLYAEVTRQMLQSGDYVTPRFAHIELLTKPPLFYWLSAPAVALMDHAEAAMRLLPGISLLLSMFLIFRIARRYWSPQTGLAAALIFFLCYDHLFNHVYRAGVMEGVLNLLMVITLWLNTQLRQTPGRIRWIAVVLALALLTKSVFAIIPAAVTAANLWFYRNDYRITRGMLLQSFGLFLAVVLPWFLLVIHAHGGAVLDYMIVDQIWKRAIDDTAAAAETGRTFGRKENFYVLRHFLEYGQPWSLLIWPALWSAVRRRGTDARETSVLLRLCCGWFIGVLLLFLVAQGRWSWYISSAYIPASILIAAMLRQFWRDPADAVAPWVWAGAGAAFLVPQAPFIFNPYETSSGGFPLYGDTFLQLLVFVTMAMIALALYRRESTATTAGAARLRAACVLALALAATFMLVVAAHWAFAPLTVKVAAKPAAGLVCLAMLAMIPLRGSPAARIACIAAPFILAAGYLAAPLHWTGHDNRRIEIRVVEREIEAGHFQHQDRLELSALSLFSFIPVYAAFNDDYEVTYEAEGGIVTLVPRTRGLQNTPR